MKKQQSNPTPDLNDVAARSLAEKIAREIMRDGCNQMATRLVLEHSGKLGSGWAYSGLVDCIHSVLTGHK